jgi:hypothetical protein
MKTSGAGQRFFCQILEDLQLVILVSVLSNSFHFSNVLLQKSLSTKFSRFV